MADGQLEDQVETPVDLEQPHRCQHSYGAPLDLLVLVLRTELARLSLARPRCDCLPPAQQHRDDEAAGDCDNDQRQQVAHHDERVLVNTVEYGAIVSNTLKEVGSAAADITCCVSLKALRLDCKNWETKQRSDHHKKPAHHPGRPGIVQVDRVDPLVDVSQLLSTKDADEDGEEDAGDFSEHCQELEHVAQPIVDGGGLEDDNIVDVHDDNFLQVGSGQSQEEELEGFDPGKLSLNDGKDEKYITHKSYARN